MSFVQEPAPEALQHRLLLEDRSRLTVSGVDSVERFDDAQVAMATARGRLVIGGSGLHIKKLSLDGGDLLVEGTIDALTYEEEEDAPQGSFLSRLFRG